MQTDCPKDFKARLDFAAEQAGLVPLPSGDTGSQLWGGYTSKSTKMNYQMAGGFLSLVLSDANDQSTLEGLSVEAVENAISENDAEGLANQDAFLAWNPNTNSWVTLANLAWLNLMLDASVDNATLAEKVVQAIVQGIYAVV